MFIERADGRITESEVDRLASHVMNGRQVRCLANALSLRTDAHDVYVLILWKQIKHAVGSARSIARENDQRLDMKHIESVLEVVEAWNVAKALK